MTHWAQDPTFSSGPRATSDSKVVPSDARLAQGIIAGQGVPSGMLNWALNQLSVLSAVLYGDGSDGAVTLGAGVTALTRDMFYASLTVPAGATLEPRGYRVFVSGLLSVAIGGIIRNNGGNGGAAASGVGGTAGIGSLSGSIGNGSAPGGPGNIDADGDPGTAKINSLGGAGGAGGASAPFAGGAGGSATTPSVTAGSWRLPSPHVGVLFSNVAGTPIWLGGGAGGGSGAVTAGPSASGGGGGGGGVLVICARNVAMDGQVQVVGGAAGATFTSGAMVGGSGGGGGGLILLMRRAESGGGSWVVDGGPGAAGGLGGSAGVAGAAGQILRITA